ncbi:MAG: hypothetical protein MK212_12100 [Saprospiraceae bacterium]|nr:hypothetical protein [Saprospiraceae bacterium]
MSRLIILLLVAFLLVNCKGTPTTNQPKTNTMNIFSDSIEIIDKLMIHHYGDLFNYMVREEVATKAWKDAGYDKLVAVVKDELAPMKARFFACEILDIKQFTYHKDVPKKMIAEIYAKALANNYTGYANSWGLLYKHNDEGTTGIIFLELWDKALPALIPLLDNDTQYLYAGSEEATVGNAYRFRVKDFAAYYIGKITRIPVVYHESHEARDKEIEALKEALKDYKKD